MKKQIKKLTLIVGIFVAIVAVAKAKAAPTAVDNEYTKTEEQFLEIIEKIIERDIQTYQNEISYKIYDNDNKLIYECTNKDDKKLIHLLRRSDLIMQTNIASYYILGDK